jgi:hypothetical protein
MGYVLGDHTGALIITHRLSTVRWLCSKFFVLRHLEGLGPGESQLEASARSFEELYETSSTFRRLADDQGERQPLGGPIHYGHPRPMIVVTTIDLAAKCWP